MYYFIHRFDSIIGHLGDHIIWIHTESPIFIDEWYDCGFNIINFIPNKKFLYFVTFIRKSENVTKIMKIWTLIIETSRNGLSWELFIKINSSNCSLVFILKISFGCWKSIRHHTSDYSDKNYSQYTRYLMNIQSFSLYYELLTKEKNHQNQIQVNELSHVDSNI